MVRVTGLSGVSEEDGFPHPENRREEIRAAVRTEMYFSIRNLFLEKKLRFSYPF
jgi:hypothetical protein